VKVSTELKEIIFQGLAASIGIILIFSSTKTNAQLANTNDFNISSRLAKIDLPGPRESTLESFRQNLRLPTNSNTTSDGSGDGNLNLFGNFGNNILDSFRGGNIYLHLGAIASTALLVTTDADYHVEHFFNQHEEYGRWARPILFTGQFLPFAAGGVLFAYAKIRNDNEALGASFAVIQASLIELMYNSTLKAITGRPNPDWRDNDDVENLSKTFRFGFLRGGIYWGWPSGHTASTMAVVSALTNYYPDKLWLKITGYGLVAYTMFGVSSVNRGGMHWFSDAVAGALMSYAVGSTVGKYYRKVYDSQNSGGVNQAQSHWDQESIPLGMISFEF
jgi:membrane-associated phospholipid phosphatase